MDVHSPTGLKPTLRQMMIVVIWAAFVVAGTRSAIRWHLLGDSPEMACLAVPVNLGIWPMPLLACLVRLFDRPGRVRAWYCSACIVAGHFLSGIFFLLQDPACYALTGRPTTTFPMGAILSLVFFWCGWVQWREAAPRLCPTCGRKSVIAVARPHRPESKGLEPTGKFGWCAICGAAFEMSGKGYRTLSSPSTSSSSIGKTQG